MSSNVTDTSKSIGGADSTMEESQEVKTIKVESQTSPKFMKSLGDEYLSKENGNESASTVSLVPISQNVRKGKYAPMTARKEKTEGSLSVDTPSVTSSSSLFDCNERGNVR